MKAGNLTRHFADIPFPPNLNPNRPPKKHDGHTFCLVRRRDTFRGGRGGQFYQRWARASADLPWATAVVTKIALNCGHKVQRFFVFDLTLNRIVRCIDK